jgi:hypothetical protein
MTLVDQTSPEVGASPAPPDAIRTARRRTAIAPGDDLHARLLALRTLPREELCAEWRRLLRANPPDRIRTDLLVLGIAWKIQEKARGGPKKAAETGLRELARSMSTTGDIGRAKRTKLKPGARLVREWGGAVHEVTVVERGFEWNGRAWASLSGIAEAITGAHWSGPRFFGLAARGKTRSGAERPYKGEEIAADA